MTSADSDLHAIAVRRAAAHGIGGLDRAGVITPARVVSRMLAMQAQDPAAVRWAVGIRMRGRRAAESMVTRALASGAVLRTHLLRGTWQLVTPRDLRWLLPLVGRRLLARNATRFLELGLDATTLARAHRAIARRLDERHHTRDELAAALVRDGLDIRGPRLAHTLWHAELSGLIVSGAPAAAGHTYALFGQRVPARNPIADPDRALAELARRYFGSRGPATLADFVWWSGLPPREARRAIEARGPVRTSPPVAAPAPVAHLLPAFDEYVVSYVDRTAVLEAARARRVNAGGGMIHPVVTVDGRIAGVWRRDLGRAHVAIQVELFARVSTTVSATVDSAARRYAAFIDREPRITVTESPSR